MYFVTACKQEYLAKNPDFQIQGTSLEAHITHEINRFVRTGSIRKENLLEDLQYPIEEVDDLRRLEQNPQTFLTRWSQLSGVPMQHELV